MTHETPAVLPPTRTATAPVAHFYQDLRRRWHLIAFLIGATIVAFLLDIATGPARLSLSEVVHTILAGPTHGANSAIVWTIRLPVALLALLVGAALGLTGALMQTLLNNPLASSYTLGISSGAGFGAALAIVLGSALPFPEAHIVPVSAFVFSGVACGLVYAIGSIRRAAPEALILAGIACLFFFQALLALLQVIASPEALQQIVFWLFGSLMRATWRNVTVLGAVLLAAAPVLAYLAWPLTALRLGEERAHSLGVDVRRLRFRGFALVSLLTGTAVAFAGTIGFIGVVAPHIARIFVGEDQRLLMPGSAIVGALLLSVASTASKSIVPGSVFPIGVITSMIGVPFFVWLITTTKRRLW